MHRSSLLQATPSETGDQVSDDNSDSISPMTFAVLDGSIGSVRYLIKAGDKERPLHLLFPGIDPSYFHGCDMVSVNAFKDKVRSGLSGDDLFTSKASMDASFVLAELLVTNFSDGIVEDVKEIKNNADKQTALYFLLPFFTFAAVNNRNDLLKSTGFQYIFDNFPEAAADSLIAAIAFGAKEYARSAMTRLGKEALLQALQLSAAIGDLEISAAIVSQLNELGLTLGDFSRGKSGKYDAMFWAIRCNQPEVVSHLLDNGFNPNYFCEKILKSSYLHVAIGLENIEIVRLLLQHGAEISCVDVLDNDTPLHKAVKDAKWDMAYMLAGDYHADIHAVNKEGKTPLDYINDDEIKTKLMSLCQKKSESKVRFSYKGAVSSIHKFFSHDTAAPKPPYHSIEKKF